ncbi:MAG: DUF429 domain-containing protein [Pseudomonadota bacterium]
MQLIGVDGCKAGWVAVVGESTGALSVGVFSSFKALIEAHEPDAIIAVDMPIGLPDRIEGGGRTPEKLVRSLLGPRQSSVFAIPARAVVEMGRQITGRTADDYPLHRRASELAKRLSDPPKGASIQAFYLFPKILEIDRLLQAEQKLQVRVFESHPEVAFCIQNDCNPMALPKKIKGKVNPQGMQERLAFLASKGLPSAFLKQQPPPGVGEDDFLDACVCWRTAERLSIGEATSFPDPPEKDGKGIPIAIWA